MGVLKSFLRLPLYVPYELNKMPTAWGCYYFALKCVSPPPPPPHPFVIMLLHLLFLLLGWK